MWLGDSQYRLAGALLTLINELVAAYPDQEWQTSPDTGTIGDAAHISEGSASDHNPWLNNTVRALDVAKTTHGPDCEALFRMVNRMYAARDPRVFPFGYAIFNGRITDWNNPGGFHAQVGDQHLNHCHISVGQSGYNATNAWPIPGNTSGDLVMDAQATAAFAALNKQVAALAAQVDNIPNGVWAKQLSYTGAAGQKVTAAAASFLIMADVNANKAMHALTDPAGPLSKLAASVKAQAVSFDPVAAAASLKAAFLKQIGA